jgi:eukaryotic-like serine/threonine-protein kinase
MVGPPTSDALVELVRKSGLIEQDRLDAYLERRCALGALPTEPKELATVLVRDGFLTCFQAQELLKGKHRGFILSKYKILERLGSGRNSSVYLCEHLSMRRKVALKILPLAKAEDPSSLARFYREGRAAGTLDHANIIRTYDNGQEGDYHFLVMEYVDGCSLEGIVQKYGPMDTSRAAAYIRQAAIGLQHVHQAGLIHRDIKPGNLLLDRQGTVKILDMGLVRFFHDHKDTLTQQYDPSTILGTADYLSPEQALNSHDVDTRTDIYSLGATFYFLLAGRPPFEGTTVRHKLLSHLTKEPTRLGALRPEVPEGLAAIVAKMMAKNREQRYQSAAEVVAALAPWTESPIAPPPAHEMAQLSPAAQSAGSAEAGPVPAATAERIAVPRAWQEQKTCASQVILDRQVANREVPVARAVEPCPAVGRSASELLNPLPLEQPSSGPEASILAPPGKSSSDNWDVAPGRQPADTVNLIADIDTCSDSLQDLPRHPASGQPAPARLSVWRRGQPRQLIVFCLVSAAVVGVAVVGGVALGTLFSRSPASVRPGHASPPPFGHFSEGQKRTSSGSQRSEE